ncbi:MAG: glycosyltransferase family 2 protein [Chloroflexi bacterium]|nr:glycosyltransferase family 2 protein [Chloroflexota bacterium]
MREHVAENSVDVSVIAPVYNEEGNILPLHHRLVDALEPLGRSFEIVYVDDGSRDRSAMELALVAARDRRARVVRLRRNFGQTAAMTAGIDHAYGAVIVFIDADLQNDPADIPRLLACIDEGFDVVSGWRKDRKDAAITRKLPSHIANGLISRVTGVHLHDYGCSLKAYRADLLKQVHLYGELHRFIPALLAQVGAQIAELPVNHFPRVRGKSKYGLKRTFKVMLDLLTVKFLGSYVTKPIHAFGAAGLLCIALSILTGLAMVWQKLALGVSMIQTPLLLLSALLLLIGFQAILMGLLGEVLMRTYHESQGKRTYVTREVLNP